MNQDDQLPSLSESNRRAFACVLDEVIPPSADGRLPGAGELGLAAVIEEKVPDLQPVLAAGLNALDEIAVQRGAAEFVELRETERREALDQLTASQPAFLPGIIFHAFTGYYLHGRVAEGLGLEARPPHPLGYEMERGDLSLLDAVRERGKIFRDC